MKSSIGVRRQRSTPDVARWSCPVAITASPSFPSSCRNSLNLPGYNPPMNVLFEEDGGFKAGTVMADNDSSLQVEMPSGKRSKIKAATVLLRFEKPSAAALLEQATPLAEEIEADFLWECVNDGEFSFLDFARDYYGHDPAPIDATAVLLALHAAPVYFHRKGKGRFRKAPADILAAALASLEKKRQQALAMEGWISELKAFSLPPAMAGMTDALLYAPDRNKPETKAFETACSETGLTAAQMLFKCGASKSPYCLHFRRLLHEQVPKGANFPALDIEHGSPLDGVARARLSTVYMPGNKITMLPDAVVQNYTLAGGVDCPAVSLYLTVNESLEIVSHESRLEMVHIAANLRHHEIEPWFNAETINGPLPDQPFKDELVHLWHFANACEGRRGKPSAVQGINDYNFSIEGDLADPDACTVEISERKRGSPLDKLVAELMIVANSTWGGLLADKNVACLYRAQTQGKVRMTTSPLPHEGLGVPQYAWMTSPRRRYCDLVNQWQLIACLKGETPAFAQKSAELFAAMRDFEITYGAYADFQHLMERYWCLRWLQQHGVSEIDATVRREQLVKLDHLPLMLRVPSLPADLAPGQRVHLAVERIDLLAPEGACRFFGLRGEAEPAEAVEEGEA